MLALEYHRDTFWINGALNCFSYLLGQTLLDLEPSGKYIHHPGNLAQADNLTPR